MLENSGGFYTFKTLCAMMCVQCVDPCLELGHLWVLPVHRLLVSTLRNEPRYLKKALIKEFYESWVIIDDPDSVHSGKGLRKVLLAPMPQGEYTSYTKK